MEEQLAQTLRNHAYCMTMTMEAQIRLEGMKAENAMRQHQMLSPAYVENDFVKLINECQQHHNAVITNMGNGIY